jgi:serine/threonine-protein kinase RsbW
MTGNYGDSIQDWLEISSRPSEIGRVHAWTEILASRHAIPENLRFAIDLCLEEVLANVIQHGYGRAADRSMIVRFLIPQEGSFVFVVEDEGPRFNPLEAPELPALSPQGEIRIGGQGIRLLRRFADTLEYEPTSRGNRLSIGFSTSGHAKRTA